MAIYLTPILKEPRARDAARGRFLLEVGKLKFRLTREEVKSLEWQCRLSVLRSDGRVKLALQSGPKSKLGPIYCETHRDLLRGLAALIPQDPAAWAAGFADNYGRPGPLADLARARRPK